MLLNSAQKVQPILSWRIPIPKENSNLKNLLWEKKLSQTFQLRTTQSIGQFSAIFQLINVADPTERIERSEQG